MAAPVWADFISGSLNNTLPAVPVGTVQSMQSSGLTTMPSVTDGTERAKLVLDPFGAQGAPERIDIVSHAYGTNTAQVIRLVGQNPRTHNASEQWVHGPTAGDFSEFQLQLDMQFRKTEFTAAGQLLSATAPSVTQPVNVGTQWQTLTVDTAQPTKLRYRDGPPFVCTTTTRPTLATGAYLGMTIFETDSLHMLVCIVTGNPCTWRYVSPPPGTVRITAGGAVEVGEVWCDGSLYNGTTPLYAQLYARIGNHYGGAGATSFAVPDLRGKFVYGWNPATAGTPATPGARGNLGGSIYKTLTGAQMPQHYHMINNHYHDIWHGHSGQTYGIHASYTVNARYHYESGTYWGGANVFVISPGGGQQHNIQWVGNQPIGPNDVNVTFTSAPQEHGDHVHDLWTNGPDNRNSGWAAGGGLNTENSGSSQQFDILPPYIFLGYTIRL